MFCYIHIPFCETRCRYCRFSTFVEKDDFKKQFYVDYLVNSIQNIEHRMQEGQLYNNNSNLNSIYFGGGTPTSLSNKQLNQIIYSLKDKFLFEDDIEITLETTPNNITQENLKEWHNIGINRLSIGIQTLNENALKEIGRIDRKGLLEKLEVIEIYMSSGTGFRINENLNSLLLLEEANANNNSNDSEINSEGQCTNSRKLITDKLQIFNISLDFIIGLPFVKKGEVLEDLKFILENYSFVKHISLYMLEDYYDYPQSWEKLSIKEEDFLLEYINCKSYLEEMGFYRYELSNFAKKDFQCKHNKTYWNHNAVIAYGLGAHGFLDGFRYAYPSTFKDYYTGKYDYKEKLKDNDIFLEKIMFGLRTSGLEKDIYKKLNKTKINEFIDSKMLEINNNNLILCDNGVVLLDYITREIL